MNVCNAARRLRAVLARCERRPSSTRRLRTNPQLCAVSGSAGGCNVHVMVDVFTQLEPPLHPPRPPPVAAENDPLHPCPRVIVNMSTSRNKKLIMILKNDNHNITSAVRINFNESRHKKCIRRRFRCTCSWNLAVSSFKV